MEPEHLLRMAQPILRRSTPAGRGGRICAVPSAWAYCALFHCLARTCVDSLTGRAGTVGNRPMWRRVYRALEHRQAKTRCESVPSRFPDEVQEFGRTFAELQSKRHFADYGPDHR